MCYYSVCIAKPPFTKPPFVNSRWQINWHCVGWLYGQFSNLEKTEVTELSKGCLEVETGHDYGILDPRFEIINLECLRSDTTPPISTIVISTPRSFQAELLGYIYIYMSISLSLYTYIYIYIERDMCVYIYIYIYIIYIYIYI